MGKKGRGKKGKTRRNNEASKTEEPAHLKRAAHSFVLARGSTGKYVSQLVLNVRKVMEPFTATNLKTKGTTVRDLASVAGPLGVTHLCMFTHTRVATYMKLAKFPRGPTLTFRVQDYTLTRDVLRSLRRMVTYSKQFMHGPLLILNNFNAAGQHVQLMATVLQNMFPVLNIHKVKLNNLRRAVLFSYNAEDETIDFRHYTVKVVPVGISRGVKKLVNRTHVPNMGRLGDMAEFVMKAGYGSESEGEEDPSSHVQLAQEVRSRGNIVNAQSAIRLVELGPRLTLQLIKAEAGLVTGEVLYHKLVSKTDEELEIIQRRRQQREQLKARRRAEQQQNVDKKTALREEQKQRSLAGMKKAMENAAAVKGSDEEDEDEDEGQESGAGGAGQGEEESDVELGDDNVEDGAKAVDDDEAWYRKEVGQEPDEDFRAIATTSGAASRSVTKRFAKKRTAPRRDESRDTKRGRGESRGGRRAGGETDDRQTSAERWKPRNKRGKPISGVKVRRKEPPAKRGRGQSGRGRGQSGRGR